MFEMGRLEILYSMSLKLDSAAAPDQGTNFDYVAGKDVQAVCFQVDVCHDGITKLGGVCGEEHGVIQAVGSAKGERSAYKPSRRVSHGAARSDGAALAGPGDAIAPSIIVGSGHAI